MTRLILKERLHQDMASLAGISKPTQTILFMEQ